MGAVDGAAGAARVGGGSVVTADALVPFVDAGRRDPEGRELDLDTLDIEIPRGFGRGLLDDLTRLDGAIRYAGGRTGCSTPSPLFGS